MSHLDSTRLRMDLLEVGEKLGWPRMPIGPGSQVRAGESNWMKLSRASMTRVVVALRNAKIRRDNLYGALDSESSRVVTFATQVQAGVPRTLDEAVKVIATFEPDLKKERDRERMARVRAARKPKDAAIEAAFGSVD